MKKGLYFFPLNPARRDAGCKTRAINLLEYFRERNVKIDFLGLEYWDDWSEQEIVEFQNLALTRHIHLLKASKVPKTLLNKIWGPIKAEKKFARGLATKNSLPNHVTLNLIDQFNLLLSKEEYDFIIISYAYWADLLRFAKNLKGIKTIIDTHDFLTSQIQHEPNVSVGKSFEEELRRLSLADEVWAISTEENFIFSQFLKNKVRTVSLSLDHPVASQREKTFDLIYVASDNSNNKTSAVWFFNEVFPKLPTHITICVIGKITSSISLFHPNLTKIKFVPSLDEYYHRAKIAICPMLGGTGVKVKVIEALSFGLPVVCTTRGMDGLPNKINNGCLSGDDPKEFAKNIVQLLQDESLYATKSSEAKQLFNNAFTKKICFESLDKSFGVK